MSWKRIVALAGLLVVLLAAIMLINRRENRKQETEGRLVTLAAGEVTRMEIVRGERHFTFERAENRWNMIWPLQTKADKTTVESILDGFCPLKYDREVEKTPRDLAGYGLDNPALELRLFAKGQKKPSAVVWLGISNAIDNSTYARLGSGGAVVMIPAFKRSLLEKETFDFRDKKFFELNTTQVTALAFTYDKNPFFFNRRDGRWTMDKPIFSLAQESRITDILSRAASLEAKAFLDDGAQKQKESGLDQPLLDATFTVAGQVRQLKVGKQGERCFAQVSGLAAIVEIDKAFLDSFFRDVAAYRQRKIMSFYAFDVRGIEYKSAVAAFRLTRDSANAWQVAQPANSKKPDDEKINQLLAALEECEAREFVAVPALTLPPFAATITIKAESVDSPGQLKTLTLQFSAPEGDWITVRDPSLPYLLKVDKAIGDKLPKTIDDLLAGVAAKPVPPVAR